MATRTEPPGAVNFTALPIRLSAIRRIAQASPIAGSVSAAMLVSSVICRSARAGPRGLDRLTQDGGEIQLLGAQDLIRRLRQIEQVLDR